MIIDEYYTFAIALSVIIYFRLSQDYIGLAYLTKWAIIFFCITAILSIYTSILDPFYARNLINGYDISQKKAILKYGGAGFSFAGALICIFPIMVYYFRNNKISIFSKSFILVFGIISIISILRMQIFANILVALLAIFSSILIRTKINRSVLIIIAIAVVFVIPVSNYSELLTGISSFSDPDSETYYKLNDLASFISNQDIDNTGVGRRFSRYPMLMNAFSKNPLGGYYITVNSVNISEGGHLYWMNRLTIMGLLGFIPYIFFHYIIIKSNLRVFSSEYKIYYLISVLSIFILGLMKNLAGREMWFTYFVILPGLYYLPLLKKKSKQNNIL